MFSVVCTVVVIVYSKKADKKDGEIVNPNDKMKISDLKKFSKLYWVMVIMVVSSVTMIWNVIMYANVWITARFG